MPCTCMQHILLLYVIHWKYFEKIWKKYEKDSYILFFKFVYIYNSLMVSLQLFADTDKDGNLCSRNRDAWDFEEDYKER